MSKVSIVIPAYNQSPFLREAIQSCLDQTHPETEVVVVDDGSTDSTPQVAQSFAGRIRYVRQENRGLPRARNRGLEESGGEYLCFLDADDTFHPEKVARQAALLDQDDQLGLVYCDIQTLDESGTPVPGAPRVADVQRVLSGDIFGSLMMGGYFPPHTVMIRRAVLDQVGPFDPDLGGHADYDLWLRVTGAGVRAFFINEPLAGYRTYASSMSKDGEHMGQTRQAVLQKIAAAHPERLGAAIAALQQASQDLFRANQTLVANWERTLSLSSSVGAGPGRDRQCFSLLKHLDRSVMVKGPASQKEVWEVTLEDVSCRALLLQPPAEISFTMPTGQPGQFLTAVAIHPEALAKPGAGGCEFQIRLNGRQAYAIALDPVRLTGDRPWHPVQLSLPANPAGPHKISLETRSLGDGSDFRWALWRAPEFSWKHPNTQDNPAPAALSAA